MSGIHNFLSRTDVAYLNLPIYRYHSNEVAS